MADYHVLRWNFDAVDTVPATPPRLEAHTETSYLKKEWVPTIRDHGRPSEVYELRDFQTMVRWAIISHPGLSAYEREQELRRLDSVTPEVGKFYKTRNHEIAYIEKFFFGDELTPKHFQGSVHGHGLSNWLLDGLNTDNSDWDIVSVISDYKPIPTSGGTE